ncbi:urease accessory protein UreE [Saccharospirillum sp. HFRX-1]|uniref:urease accessory protein UreE n=1 Tax=unclassified Saccharospirillum TaxID=2633430 RepID=UPI003722A16D
MLNIHERLGTQTPVDSEAGITLTFEQREKGRLRVFADSGEEVRLFLERGRPLAVGEILKSECGRHLQVKGALEATVIARCDDWLTFARACYHLGNRHTKVEVGERWLRIQPDHVLEDMLHGLGLTTEAEMAVFNPESGAYSHGHHHH